MLITAVRLGVLLTTLVASLHVAAEPRYWTLTGVPNTADRCCFEAATGYFSYDDSTNTISNWNVRVDGFQFVTLPPFTYVPGNSTVNVSPPSGATGPTFSFSAAISVPEEGGWFRISGVRQLQITPLTALDGSTATVSLDTSLSREALPSLVPTRVRQFNGRLTLTPVPPQVVIAQVDEFYHTTLRHFFITADDAEKQALDTGVPPDWLRTGYSFKAYARGSSTGASIYPVCRYYSPAIVEFEDGNEVGSDSHFFSADWDECAIVLRRYGYAWWLLEFDNAFQIALPDKSSGACPVGTIPVYRLWNQRVDSNHRYTTSAPIRAQMLAAGYLSEGYGPDGVVMCAAQ